MTEGHSGYTVRKTLPISAPTSACRQPDSVHKQKIPFAFVLFTQRKFAFVLSFSPSVNFLLSFTSSGKLKTMCNEKDLISNPSMLDSITLLISLLRLISMRRFKHYTVRNVFVRREKYLLFVTFLEK